MQNQCLFKKSVGQISNNIGIEKKTFLFIFFYLEQNKKSEKNKCAHCLSGAVLKKQFQNKFPRFFFRMVLVFQLAPAPPGVRKIVGTSSTLFFWSN
jgi:hypothetical protein